MMQDPQPPVPLLPSSIGSQRIRRVLSLIALLLAASCTVPNPNYRRDAAPGDGAVDPTSPAKELKSLVFLASNNPGLAADVTAVIDGTTVKATVPFGRNRSLVATFITTGTRVEIGGVPQESGVTSNAFLAPVIYRVVAGDGSTQDYNVIAATPVQQAYVKASNTDAQDNFGHSVAVSGDGNTLAIGAVSESSATKGIGGTQENNSARQSGAVYVFTRSASGWTQQAYIKASNAEAEDFFGYSVALSADGNTLAVGALKEDSGISDIEDDNSVFNSGAVYMFIRSGSAWKQQAYIKASNAEGTDYFGASVALSADGNTLAVGAYGEASQAIGINGDQSNNSAPGSGAVYVFTRSGSAWKQQSYIKASNTGIGDRFGCSVALSADGNTLAAGAYGEASAATGIDGSQGDSADFIGAVYAFTRSGNVWRQQAYIKASNTDQFDAFGFSVALSADGNTLAVGARGEASAATGIDSDQGNNSALDSGAVYLFTRSGAAWSQQAYIKASNTNPFDNFGYSVALSADGNTLAIGAYGEASEATGIGGGEGDNSANQSGAAYAFTRSGVAWSQQAYVKASNSNAADRFGFSVALSADGVTLAVGGLLEDSAGIGVNDNNAQSDNSKPNSGAVYVFQ